MFAANYVALVLCLIGRLKAEYCTQDGNEKMCLITSDLANQNDDGELLGTVSAELNENDTAVRIDIEIPCLYLTQNVSFSQLDSLIFNGDPSSLTVINCTGSDLDGDTGIVFTKIMNIALSNLMLISCGSKFKVREKWYSSALRVHSCGNLHLTNLAVTKSRGIGLMILHHLQGTVYVALSNFTDNRISQHKVYGGGGVYIGEFEHSSSSSVQFEFEHCRFERNVAHTRHYHSYYTDEFGNSQTGNGQGGGVFLAFERSITQGDVRVFFSHCTFTENQAFFGGGLSVKIGVGRSQVIITKIIVTVESSVFKSNGCSKNMNNQWHSRIGGGAYLSYYSIRSPSNYTAAGSEYHFRNVNFTGNCAELGGGVYFFSIRQASNNNSLQFESCRFEKNMAHIGSAIDLTPSSFVKLSAGEVPVPVFRKCTFLENYVYYGKDSHNKQRATGIGTLYASLYDVKFEQVNHFENNRGTGVYMVNGVANFSNSSAIFRNNRGIRGGAIALIGASAMIVGPSMNYRFEKNRANFQGGAIYVLMINNHDFTVSRSCFIQYFDGGRFRVTRDWSANITFYGNTAQIGHAIFATSLHPCQAINNNTEDKSPFYITVNSSEVFAARGIDVDESEIATEGAQLHYEDKVLRTIPGQQYYHGVILKDDTGQPVNEPLRTNIHNNTKHTVSLDPAFSLYVREKIQLNGTPGGQADILLQTVSNRQSYAILQVVLEECPPGFKLENKVCVCNSNSYFGLTECDTDNFFSYLIPGLWMGQIKEGNVIELATSVCPHSFCNYNNKTVRGVVLPQKSAELDSSMCGESREGTLCGHCSKQYTAHFHSPKFRCWREDDLCKVGWLFYILSELVPVTVVFIIVIVFNISFTSGAVNGFILFSQVLLSLNIDASGIIRFPNQKSITEGYQFLYGFLNLDFFTTDTMSFCLWPNATALDMLAFKYVTIIYALSLVILVIWFMNKCGGRCLGQWWRITTVKSSIIHGITAFFIICYSQSIMVSHNLVTGGKLWLKEGSNMTVSRRVWLNGNIVHFSREHLRYALPALLCLLTIGIIPPTLLLVYPLSNKVLSLLGYEESKIVTYLSQKLPINTLKPILDSFQGCFKDNLRFFAGLYFLYRWMAPIVYSTAPSLGTAYIVTEILLILMLAIHAFSQPYTKRVHNMVDTVLFTDLLLINSITCIHYFLFQSQENRQAVKQKVVNTSIIQAVLIYLPFTIMAIYVLVMGYKRISRYGCSVTKHAGEGASMEENSSTVQTLRRLRAAVQSFSSVNGDISVQDDEELPHRLLAGHIHYEYFEDTDNARETHVDPLSDQSAPTY